MTAGSTIRDDRARGDDARGTKSRSHVPLAENAPGGALLLVTLAMLALGVVMVHSALAGVAVLGTGGQAGQWYQRVDVRHTIFAVLALAVLATAWRFDYRRLIRGRWGIVPAVALGISVFCCIIVLTDIGHAIGGQKRWLRVGPPSYAIGFQPSELLKLSLVIFLAAWLGRPGVRVRGFVSGYVLTFLPAALLIGVCAGLVITQDFGTAVLIGLSASAALVIAGVPWYYLLTLVPPGGMAFWLLVIREPHRWARIDAYLTPDAQIINANIIQEPSLYQPQQSMLAIARGGWFGQGLGNGVIKQGFLPEDTTDFIFSVYCEEWGFAGAVLLIALVLLWVWLARRAAVTASDRFGTILAGSLGVVVAMQMVLHIAVDTMSIPPTGMSFPFISAGGTGLVIMASAVALIISVTAHRGSCEQSLIDR